jgi:hypothetical protein
LRRISLLRRQIRRYSFSEGLESCLSCRLPIRTQLPIGTVGRSEYKKGNEWPVALAYRHPPTRIGVLPLERTSRLGVGPDVAHEFPGQVADGGEDAACDQLALDPRKPNLHLVQPGRIRRSEVQANARLDRCYQPTAPAATYKSRVRVSDFAASLWVLHPWHGETSS